MQKIDLVILALPASQYCVGRKTAKSAVRSLKRPKPGSSSAPGPHLLFAREQSEQLLHYYKYVSASVADTPANYQIPWLQAPRASLGLYSEDRLMNSEAGCSSFVATMAQQHETNHCTGTNGGNLSGPYSTVTIIPRKGMCARSSLLEKAAQPAMTRTASLLEAMTNFVNSTTSVKKRHGSDQRSMHNCCLCHPDPTDRRAVNTMDEMKAFLRKDVQRMLQPIYSRIAEMRSDLENKHRELLLPREQQPQAVQMVNGDVQIPKDAFFLRRRNHDPEILLEQGQSSKRSRYDASVDRRVPEEEVPKEFAGNSTEARNKSAAQTDWYSDIVKGKDLEIGALTGLIYELVGQQDKLTLQLEKVNKEKLGKEFQCSPGPVRPTLHSDLLNSACIAALAALDSFAACFVSYSAMRYHSPANKIWKPNFRNVYLTREGHWMHALKAFFCEKMFLGFENETFMTDAASLYLDPARLRMESYVDYMRTNGAEFLTTDVHFRTFCEQKFDLILPDELLLQPDDYDLNDLTNDAFPTVEDINLSRSFAKAALKVWTLHKLCFSFEPAASIFRARRGLAVDWKYMESVVRLEDDQTFVPKVGFMISPGFRVHNLTVKSQIYLAGKTQVNNVGIHGQFFV